MTRLLAFLAASLVVVVAVVGLRAATMTAHTRMPRDSHLEIEATARWRGAPEAAANRARALAYACVAESSSSAIADDFRWRADGRFTVRVTPALDDPDRRQLDGCLSDLRMPRLLVTVDRMRSTGIGGEER
jgi:hypothetical protein